jgi:hypothetical protein
MSGRARYFRSSLYPFRMANENNAALGRNALVTDVDFSIGNSPTLSKADKRKSKLGR